MSDPLTLGTYPSALIRISCSLCERMSQYSRSALLKRFSADMPISELLVALTECHRHGNGDNPCRMSYPDLCRKTPASKPCRKR